MRPNFEFNQMLSIFKSKVNHPISVDNSCFECRVQLRKTLFNSVTQKFKENVNRCDFTITSLDFLPRVDPNGAAHVRMTRRLENLELFHQALQISKGRFGARSSLEGHSFTSTRPSESSTLNAQEVSPSP